MTYRIIARTNGWIARCDPMFDGSTEVVLESNLTLREAQQKLLDMFNDRFENIYFHNWGMAVIYSQSHPDNIEATPTFPDGTRRFEDDGRQFSIEEETEY
jgi:hypothetical protein